MDQRLSVSKHAPTEHAFHSIVLMQVDLEMICLAPVLSVSMPAPTEYGSLLSVFSLVLGAVISMHAPTVHESLSFVLTQMDHVTAWSSLDAVSLHACAHGVRVAHDCLDLEGPRYAQHCIGAVSLHACADGSCVAQGCLDAYIAIRLATMTGERTFARALRVNDSRFSASSVPNEITRRFTCPRLSTLTPMDQALSVSMLAPTERAFHSIVLMQIDLEMICFAPVLSIAMPAPAERGSLLSVFLLILGAVSFHACADGARVAHLCLDAAGPRDALLTLDAVSLHACAHEVRVVIHGAVLTLQALVMLGVAPVLSASMPAPTVHALHRVVLTHTSLLDSLR